MPIIGYFILFGNFTDQLFSIAGDRLGLNPNEAEEFSISSLYLIYFGLLLFSLSTVTYNVMCPDLVKEFSNRYEFFSKETDAMTSGRVVSIAREMNEKFGIDVDLEFDDGAGSENSNTSIEKGAKKLEKMRTIAVKHSREHFISKYSGPVLDLLHQKYDLYDTSQLRVRQLIFYTYIASTILIAIPTFRTVCLIIASLFN